MDIPDDLRSGFLAIRAPRAAEISKALRDRGVFTDARGEILRLGPAPYLSDEQLHEGIQVLDSVLRRMVP
jgi:kynureninase